MAGPYTHWMVAQAALGREMEYARLNPGHPLATTVINNMPCVQVGAVSPDMPNLTLGQSEWADRMHYEAIGALMARAVGKLLRLKNTGPRLEFELCLAWTMGLVAHVVADVVIHPIVNLVVGPYVLNKDEHRKCEMAQDAYIFKRYMKMELVDAQYARILPPASDLNAVFPFWESLLVENYPGRGQPSTASWYDSYVGLLNVAAGLGSQVPAVFRHAGASTGYFYQKTTAFQPADVRYFTSLRIPGASAPADFDLVFARTVERVVAVWGQILADLEAGDAQHCLSYLRDWNLDLGVDQGRLDLWA